MEFKLQDKTSKKMQSLTDLLRRRLLFSIGIFLLCIIISAILGIFAAWNQQQLGEQKVRLHDNANALLQAMVDQETGVRGYINTGDKVFLQPNMQGRANYQKALQNLKGDTNSSDFSATVHELGTVDNRAHNWVMNYADPQMKLVDSGQRVQAQSPDTNSYGKSLFDSFREAEAQLQHDVDNNLTVLQNRTTILDICALTGSVLLSLLALWWLWFTFKRFVQAQREQLDILNKTTEVFGSGDLGARVMDVRDADLSRLGETFNTMAQTLQQQQQALSDRDILEQVSQLNAVLTDSLDLSELTRLFMQQALRTLDAQVAALYLYDHETQRLTLFSSQGIQIEHTQQSFALEEGFVGRVASEREPLMLSDRNQNQEKHFQVRTVVGTVLPSSLYHLPLVHANELMGVLVIGSIFPMSEQTRNVFYVVSSNVAAAISNALAYEYTQKQNNAMEQQARELERINLALRQQRDELTVLNGALEEANRARSQFLSTMSHELRTPLTSIIGFSQMLLRSTNKAPLTNRQSGNIDRILKNAQHLLMLINDVLDLAKVEAGRMDVNASEVDLQQLLSSVVDETKSIALERDLKLHLEIEEDLPQIETDARKVQQILLNLISNSLKFTEKGSVTVAARKWSGEVEPEEMRKGERVAISVIDTGIGIEPEKQDKIFDAFYQVDSSSSRSYGGTGLGLSIVRELTMLLGGKVEIQSELYKGTTFTIVLPIRIRGRKTLPDLRLNHPAALSNNLPSLHVGSVTEDLKNSEQDHESNLVIAIDDNPDVLQLISAALEQSPYRVLGIQDSTQAIAIIEEMQPKAVTLDIMMPRVNGWQILHQLKSNPRTVNIPVILLTVLEDRSAGYVLGANEYLVKPVARDKLLNSLNQLIASIPFTEGTLSEPMELPELIYEKPVNDASVSINNEVLRSIIDKQILVMPGTEGLQQILDKVIAQGVPVYTPDTEKDLASVIEKASTGMLMMLIQVANLKREVQGSTSPPDQE